MKEQLKNVKHDYIRYANCWEDADVLLNALNVQSTDKVLSIASAGDNSFSLLSKGPKMVVSVDINPTQLNLVELKKAAFKALNYDEFVAFLGFEPSTTRLETYKKVKMFLSEELNEFWSRREDEIENGIIYAGKFERYFELFRTRILPLIHTKKRIQRLFETKTAEEQRVFYEKKWNNWRWRLLFKLFFSKFVMGKFGRDPAFLKEVEVPVAEFINGQAARHLSSVHCQTNYFLHLIMKGNFQIASNENSRPHFARRENFESIKNNIDNLIVHNGLAESAFQEYGTFSKFNLSNIFEYMNPELFLSVANNLTENGVKNARYAYWNLMVPRELNNAIPLLEADEKLNIEQRIIDKGFFYKGINIDVKK